MHSTFRYAGSLFVVCLTPGECLVSYAIVEIWSLISREESRYRKRTVRCHEQSLQAFVLPPPALTVTSDIPTWYWEAITIEQIIAGILLAVKGPPAFLRRRRVYTDLYNLVAAVDSSVPIHELLGEMNCPCRAGGLDR